MNKAVLITGAVVFLAFSVLIARDIYAVKHDISINQKTIDTLTDFNNTNERTIKDLALKIERIKNSPKAAETLLIQKYKMLRKDQFIVRNGEIH